MYTETILYRVPYSLPKSLAIFLVSFRVSPRARFTIIFSIQPFARVTYIYFACTYTQFNDKARSILSFFLLLLCVCRVDVVHLTELKFLGETQRAYFILSLGHVSSVNIHFIGSLIFPVPVTYLFSRRMHKGPLHCFVYSLCLWLPVQF